MRSIVIFDTTMFQYERDAQRVYEAIIKRNGTFWIGTIQRKDMNTSIWKKLWYKRNF